MDLNQILDINIQVSKVFYLGIGQLENLIL